MRQRQGQLWHKAVCIIFWHHIKIYFFISRHGTCALLFMYIKTVHCPTITIKSSIFILMEILIFGKNNLHTRSSFPESIIGIANTEVRAILETLKNLSVLRFNRLSEEETYEISRTTARSGDRNFISLHEQKQRTIKCIALYIIERCVHSSFMSYPIRWQCPANFRGETLCLEERVN